MFELENIYYSLLSEITVEQFMRLIGTFVILVLIYIFLFVPIVHFVVDFIYGLFRKDKYKSTGFAIIEAHRYIARLRRQVKFAPDSETFVIQYNRLVGAVAFLVHMGYIKSEFSTRILNVIPEFYSKDDE